MERQNQEIIFFLFQLYFLSM